MSSEPDMGIAAISKHKLSYSEREMVAVRVLFWMILKMSFKTTGNASGCDLARTLCGSLRTHCCCCESAEFVANLAGGAGVYLHHENSDHVLFRIDPESGARCPAPSSVAVG